MSDYLKPNWVTLEGKINNFFNDYRPAIGPDGKAVVFERTFYDPELRMLVTKLFIVNDLNTPSSQLFLTDCDFPQQTRPAWTGDGIVLNLEGEGPLTVWTVDADGTNLKQIENTEGCNYPQWAIDSSFKGFVVMNAKKLPNLPQPHSTLFDVDGNRIIANMNGKDINGNTVFGGMPAVFPDNPRSIAFAGQSSADGSYNQEENYIFINNESGGAFLSMPMESSASLDHFDKHFQGRAPAISPDGNYIAFESNRSGNYALYLFNLNKPENGAVQLTDSTIKLNAQHPKFFPNGSQLIFSAVPPGYSHNCIAWIDISDYL